MIKDFLRGIVVGIANILPGVSGGMLLISMGIYDKLIYCLNNLMSELGKNIRFLLPVIMGVAVAFVGMPLIIEPAFEVFPLQANCLFIGLIIGGVPALIGKLRASDGKIYVKPGYIVSFVAFFAVILSVALIGDAEAQDVVFQFSPQLVMQLLIMGVLLSSTIIIPGLSGSMVLLVLGYYRPLIENINLFVKSCMTMNLDGILSALGILLPVGMGIILGIFGLAKLIEIVFKRFPFHSYWAILGLISASPIAILLVAGIKGISVLGVVWAAVAVVVGFFAATKLGD